MRQSSGALERGAVEVHGCGPFFSAALAAFDPWAKQVFQHCLEGNSTSDIAELMGCSRWSVRRTLDAIGLAIESRLKATDSQT